MKTPTTKDISSYDSELEWGPYVIEYRREYDEDMGPPWEEHDGHGVVSGWTTRDKRPGERVLAHDHESKRYYDWEESMKLARRDGWGLGDKDKAELAKRLGKSVKKLTPGEITEEAVRRDFLHLHDWCNDKWHWIGVVVKLWRDGSLLGKESLWGIDGDETDYWKEVVCELAETLLRNAETESQERAHWEARDTVTK